MSEIDVREWISGTERDGAGKERDGKGASLSHLKEGDEREQAGINSLLMILIKSSVMFL